ncbi:MAG: rhodanese-like domain-containing protein, partial [Halodesulfurarchaeum sp.]
MDGEIPPEEVKAKIEDGDGVRIVDIRPPEQFEEGHLPGAVNIPMQDLPAQVQEYDWEDDVIVVCPIGQSSKQAAKLIKSYEGVEDDTDVRSMEGGYDAWNYGLEVEST